MRTSLAAAKQGLSGGSLLLYSLFIPAEFDDKDGEVPAALAGGWPSTSPCKRLDPDGRHY